MLSKTERLISHGEPIDHPQGWLLSMLVVLGMLKPEKVDELLGEAEFAGVNDVIGMALSKGTINPLQIATVMGAQFGMNVVDLTTIGVIPQKVIDRLHASYAWKGRLIPIEEVHNVLIVAIADASDLDAIDGLRFAHLDQQIDFVVAVPEEVDAAIRRYYPGGQYMARPIKPIIVDQVPVPVHHN